MINYSSSMFLLPYNSAYITFINVNVTNVTGTYVKIILIYSFRMLFYSIYLNTTSMPLYDDFFIVLEDSWWNIDWQSEADLGLLQHPRWSTLW